MTHFCLLDVATKLTRRLTTATSRSASFAGRRTANWIAFDHRVNGRQCQQRHAQHLHRQRHHEPFAFSYAGGTGHQPVWSPDGTRIAFELTMANPFVLLHERYDRYDPGFRRRDQSLVAAFDEDPSLVAWKRTGFCFRRIAADELVSLLLEHGDQARDEVAPVDGQVGLAFSVSATGEAVAFIGATPTRFPESMSRRAATTRS